MKSIIIFFCLTVSFFSFSNNQTTRASESIFYTTYEESGSTLKIHTANTLKPLYFFSEDSIVSILSEEYDYYSSSNLNLYVSGKDSLYLFEFDRFNIESSFKKTQSFYAPNIIKLKKSKSSIALHSQNGFNHTFQLYNKQTKSLINQSLVLNTTHFHDYIFSSDTSLAISYVAKNELNDDIMKISCYKTDDLSLIPTFNYAGTSWQHTSIGVDDQKDGLFVALNFAHKLFKINSQGEIISDTTFSNLYDIISENTPSHIFFCNSTDNDLLKLEFLRSTNKFKLISTEKINTVQNKQFSDLIIGIKKGVTDTIVWHESQFTPLIYDKNITAFTYLFEVISGLDNSITKQSNNFTLLKQDLKRLDLKDVTIYSTNSKCVTKSNDCKNINTNELKAGVYILTAVENSNVVKYRLLIE